MTCSADDNAYQYISIANNGIGFAPGYTERIFDMFGQLYLNNPNRRYHGSGIGLTICRKIVQAHGGYIEAEGEPGKGSIFRCYLSLAPELKEFNMTPASSMVKFPGSNGGQ